MYVVEQKNQTNEPLTQPQKILVALNSNERNKRDHRSKLQSKCSNLFCDFQPHVLPKDERSANQLTQMNSNAKKKRDLRSAGLEGEHPDIQAKPSKIFCCTASTEVTKKPRYAFRQNWERPKMF